MASKALAGERNPNETPERLRRSADEREGCVMAEKDSRNQQDELLAKVTLADPAATDEALVAAAKLGDHPAFLELWRRHSNRVFKTAYGIMGKREDNPA